MTYSVKVDGAPVPFTPGARFSWTLSMGVGAPIQTWELPLEMVNRLLTDRLGEEIELELNGKKISRVIFIGNAPSSHPETQLAVFADVRWYLLWLWCARDFNKRRRAGDTRLVGDGPIEARAVAQDVQFAPYSLDPNGSVAWLWPEATRNVLDFAVNNAMRRLRYVVDDATLAGEPGQIVETEIDDELFDAVSRALGSMPGRSLIVDLQGVLHVCDAMPGAEESLAKKLPPALVNHGSLVRVNNAARRPKDGYAVLFTSEYEVRFDFDAQAVPDPDSEDLFLENVLPSPDVQLDVPATNGRPARIVGTGSYLTHAEAYAAWGAPAVSALEHQPGPLTEELVRAAFLGDLLNANYVQRFSTEADGLWGPRIEETHNTYRVLFRVNPNVWARVKSARAVRAVIGDTETGTRPKSPVYANTARKYALRALAAGVTKVGFNDVKSYPASGLLKDGTPARADVEIADYEQGVLSILFKKPKGADTMEIAPSALEVEPDIDPSQDPLVQSYTWPTRKLAADHKLSLLLSLVPAAPNDLTRFFQVRVTLAEAFAAIFAGGTATSGVPEAVGPIQWLRSRIANARFAWSDEETERLQIQAPFSSELSAQSGLAVDELVGDAAPIQPVNFDLELKPAAVALCAQHLAQRLDHRQGVFKTPMDTTILPIGSFGVVIHSVSGSTVESAEAVTTIQATAAAPVISTARLLPASARKILFREVQP